MLWALKYAPQKIEEIAGNDEAKAQAKKWALEWARGKKQKPLLVYGPSGVGKTALARVISREFGWILVETGASEARGSDGLQKQFGEAGSKGLFGTRLLLVDDLDAVLDRGGLQALAELLENSTQPVVLCANDAWDPKLAKIREATVRVEFKRVNKTAVKGVLERIAAKEKMRDAESSETGGGALEKTIDAIATSCGGDLRGAITDLQSGTSSEREREEDVFKSLAAVFKGSFNDALAADPEDYELFILWLEENIPLEYEDAGDMARAYEWLSKANIFKGRIMKRQDYGLKRYERALAFGGVAAAKKHAYRKFSRYQFPTALKLLSRTKSARQALKAAGLKAAAKLHCSSKQALETLKLVPEKTFESLGLDDGEKASLEGLRKT